MTSSITITIPVEVRELRPDDVKVKVWTGTKWSHLDWKPFSPALAARTKTAPHSYRVKLLFSPAGTVSLDQLRYRRELLVSMRKRGVIR